MPLICSSSSSNRSASNRQQGFSLVELMTVVAIVSILATLTIPEYLYISKKKVDNAQIALIAKHIQMIKQSESMTLGAYLGDWDFVGCKTQAELQSATCKAIMDDKMKKIGFMGAKKNPWGYYYSINANEGQHMYGAGRCQQDAINTFRPPRSRNDAFYAVPVPVDLLLYPPATGATRVWNTAKDTFDLMDCQNPP